MRRPPHPLTAEEAARLLDACSDDWHGARDRALLVILYRGGARISEALGLDIDDIHDRAGGMIVRYRRVKGYSRGASPREVGLDPKASDIVQTWLGWRGVRPGPLFVTRAGPRVLACHVRRFLPILARRAGIRRRVHPHAFRHTFARELYDERVGMKEIQLALGHRSLSTTDIYLQGIGATEVIAITRAREW